MAEQMDSKAETLRIVVIVYENDKSTQNREKITNVQTRPSRDLFTVYVYIDFKYSDQGPV